MAQSSTSARLFLNAYTDMQLSFSDMLTRSFQMCGRGRISFRGYHEYIIKITAYPVIAILVHLRKPVINTFILKFTVSTA